ncbi:MAG: flagellar biosynthetic protein FliR [Deltaproteobacteria bacterium]|nr:flagellar biosynthetic protein FliR [Deltaproteobacteria bacterium]
MPFPVESLDQMQGFFWVLVRVSIILFLLPIFGAKGVPILWKAGFSLLISMILTPLVPPPKTFPETAPEVLIGVLSEGMMGVLMAFGVKMLFSTVQIAGQFMAFQMGFSMARAMDPVTGAQSTVLSQFLYLFLILIFFSIDGHHYFIQALAHSFYVVPPNGFHLNGSLSTLLVKTSSQMLGIALKIAAPIIIALFLTSLALGIVARTVPQVNILMIGFPIRVAIGLIFFGFTISNLAPFLADLTKSMYRLLMEVIYLAGR